MMVVGPSECGKSKSIVLGTILEWPGSVLSLDIKGEHERLTAALQKQRGHLVQTFEPRSPGSQHINPLKMIPFGDDIGREVAAVQRVSNHLTEVGDQVSSSRGAIFFRDSNRDILESVFLYQGNFDPPATLGRARWAMGNMGQMLDAMSRVDHHIVKSQADDLKSLPLPKRSELWRSARNVLRVFDDPILAANTDDTTIDLSSLQFGEQPQTVYIRVTPDDARGSLRNVIRLLLDQHLAAAGQRRVVGEFRHHELINLDDQFEIGYLAAADHVGAFYREHGIWLMSVFQSFEQLTAYGTHASLLDNSKTWVVFRPQHSKSSRFVSEKLDKTTVADQHVTHMEKGKTTTTVLHARDLMTPFEVEHIPDYHAFVFRGGVPPILAQQVPFTDRRLI
jgi:type IV secretion system protein VirD4